MVLHISDMNLYGYLWGWQFWANKVSQPLSLVPAVSVSEPSFSAGYPGFTNILVDSRQGRKFAIFDWKLHQKILFYRRRLKNASFIRSCSLSVLHSVPLFCLYFYQPVFLFFVFLRRFLFFQLYLSYVANLGSLTFSLEVKFAVLNCKLLQRNIYIWERLQTVATLRCSFYIGCF